jgi:hypothetical protein
MLASKPSGPVKSHDSTTDTLRSEIHINRVRAGLCYLVHGVRDVRQVYAEPRDILLSTRYNQHPAAASSACSYT